jgi:hypothetical protein
MRDVEPSNATLAARPKHGFGLRDPDSVNRYILHFSLSGPKLSCSNCLRSGTKILGNLVDRFHDISDSYCAHFDDLLLRASIPPESKMGGRGE